MDVRIRTCCGLVPRESSSNDIELELELEK